MRESILYATFRTFFVTIAWMLAIAIGITVISVSISEIFETTEHNLEIEHMYTPRILPNASGIRKELSSDAPIILRINIDGIIGGKTVNRDTIGQQLIESREKSLKNDRVKALLLYINSPGGTQTDSDAIYRLVKEYKERYRVPVYAYVDGLCASGGMYIACAADQVFATETSLVGSIGVIAPSFMNFSDLLEKVGVTSMTLYEGKGKDDLNPLRPWKPGEEDNYKTIIDILYNDFVNIVVKNRPRVDKTRLVEEFGAKIYVAPQALENGFIDAAGASYSDTLRTLAKKIGIDDDYYQVVEMFKETWLSEFLNEHEGGFGTVTHRLELPMELDPAFNNQILFLHRP